MKEIEKNGYYLKISRYVSTAPEEETVNLEEVRQEFEKIKEKIQDAKVPQSIFARTQIEVNPITKSVSDLNGTVLLGAYQSSHE